jgi:hypothetical protein
VSGIKVGMRVEVLKNGWAGNSKISRGSKGTVVSSQGFMREHFTVLFDNGITVTELVSSDLKETDLGFFRLGARR